MQTFDDIRNYDALSASLKKFNPDIIIHLAAQPLVRDSYNKPKYTYETNVMGTVNLLEVAKELNSLSSILVITSDKMLQNREIDYAYSENDALGGYDPYSSSKACADLIANSYYNSFFSQMNVGLATASWEYNWWWRLDLEKDLFLTQFDHFFKRKDFRNQKS